MSKRRRVQYLGRRVWGEKLVQVFKVAGKEEEVAFGGIQAEIGAWYFADVLVDDNNRLSLKKRPEAVEQPPEDVEELIAADLAAAAQYRNILAKRKASKTKWPREVSALVRMYNSLGYFDRRHFMNALESHFQKEAK